MLLHLTWAQKSAKEHAAQLAKFKADKEEVEAKQIRLQKEMREEVERMKTQVIFKVNYVYLS